jgi:GNAT superfamily N-acetyltransferase
MGRMDLADVDLVALQDLARRVWPVGRHPGGLAWEVTTDQLADTAVAWIEGDVVVGCAGVSRPGSLVVQVDLDREDIATEAIDWLLETASGDELTIDVSDDDGALLRATRAAGFELVTDARPGYGMRRKVRGGTGLPLRTRPPTADAYVVRPTSVDETEARVSAHQAAWSWDALPWHPDHRPPRPPSADLSLADRLAREQRVRAAPLYDRELDLVVEAPDGTLAACCIVWFDETTRSAEIEPLGVVPPHRRRGLAQLLCDEACARVAERGGREVFINNGPNVAYPAPAGAYAKAGFDSFVKTRPYALIRTRSG